MTRDIKKRKGRKPTAGEIRVKTPILKKLLRKAEKARKIVETEIYEGENTEDYANVPALQVDLNVLSAGENFCILKDKVSRDIFSVERSIRDGEIFLKLIQKGSK